MDAQAREHPTMDFELVISENAAADLRRENRPTGVGVGQIAGFIPDNADGEDDHNKRNVVIRYKNGRLEYIHDLNPAYDPMRFPILFPLGEPGWGLGMEYTTPGNGPTAPVTRRRDHNADDPNGEELTPEQDAGPRRHITMREYAVFNMTWRETDDFRLPRAGKLYQEYLVDSYVKIEASRLSWHRHNQDTIRADLYQDVCAGDNLHDMGRRVVLASSFTGGPRHMQQLYQDAMAIVRAKGKPDLFVTITCNADWPEIKAAMRPGMTPSDQVDIINRVFKMKLADIKVKIFKYGVLGRVVGHVHTIEFQKRGLPHAHILLILAEEHKPRTPEQVDRIVCAELPHPVHEKELYDIISKVNMHGPCGEDNPAAACCKAPNGDACSCTKKFPDDFREETELTDGYPRYRRRDAGEARIMAKCSKDGVTKDLDNRWVATYNRALSLLFKCHINVQVVTSISSIKYVYKYVYKGHDRAQVELRPVQGEGGDADTVVTEVDEITNFTSGRYIGACEAAWRIRSFELHQERPTVQRLAVHKENQQEVFFNADEDTAADVERRGPPATTLTDWFKLNQDCPAARDLLYHDVPSKYRWVKGEGWRARQRFNDYPPVGRMYFANMREGERYFLRCLLTIQRGCKSFDDIRTVDGVVYDTYKQAAVAANLFDDDKMWEDTLAEAAAMGSPTQLRELFASLLIFAEPADPGALWDKFKKELCEDIWHRCRTSPLGDPDMEFHDDMADAGLTLIEEALRRHGTNFSDPNRHRNITPPRGEPQTLTALREVLFPTPVARGERLLQIEHAYDRDALRRQVRAGPLNPKP